MSTTRSKILLPMIGLLQGLMFYWVYKHETLSLLLAHPSLIRAVLIWAFLLPVCVYLTEAIAGLTRAKRSAIIALVSLFLYALIEYNLRWSDGSLLFPVALLAFAGLHLTLHHRRVNPSHHAYTDLFETSWRNVMMLLFAFVLTGVFWGVLFAGAALMHTIGIGFFKYLLTQSWFSIPATTTAFAIAIGLALVRSNLLVSLRRLLLSLNAWFLPLVLLFATLWVLSTPITGLNGLFSTRNAAFILLWVVALSVLFTNAAYQDGDSPSPYPAWLNQVLRITLLSLMGVSGVAIWALSLRIAQHGWTVDRIWGMFVALLAAGYSVGYAASLWQGKRGWLNTVGTSNTIMAYVLCTGIFLLCSPILDANRIAAQSQVSRLSHQKIDAEHFDYEALSHMGIWGQRALNDLRQSNDANIAQRAQAKPQNLPDTPVKEQVQPIQVLDKEHINVALDHAARNYIINTHQPDFNQTQIYELDACGKQGEPCTFWWVDLNQDGQSELVLIKPPLQASVFEWDNRIKKVGDLNMNAYSTSKPFNMQTLIDAIVQKQVSRKNNPWQTLEVLGQKITY